MHRVSSHALLILCCLLLLAGCTGGSGSQPKGTFEPTETPEILLTPTAGSTITPTSTPTQTPPPTATAVFPTGCPGFRNTSKLQDDDLVERYWQYSRERDREIVVFVARANGVNPNDQEKMGDLSQSQILAAARFFWEHSPEGRARCGDLAAILVAAGVLRSDALR